MYSAVQQDGVRLYRLARQGREVPRDPRPITVHRLVVTRLDLPRVELDLHCSKGTYVRELGAEIGRRLGCGAHTVALRRTRSGPFDLAQAVTLDELDPDRVPLLSLAAASAHLPTLVLDASLARRVQDTGYQPATIDVWPALRDRLGVDTAVRLLDPAGALVAVAEVRAELDPRRSAPRGDALKLLRVFPR